jgi:hypothetical protein
MTADPDDCRAQVVGYEVITEKEIFEYVTRQGSGITTAEAKANYEELIGAIEYFLKKGYGFNTEFFNIRPTMPGVFRNMDDKFDPSRHKIRFKVLLGKRYNHTSDDVKVEKVSPVNNAPLPNLFEDITSATVNELITPGGTAMLKGIRLKFDQNDLSQGIFLISDQEEFRVEQVLSHNSSHIVFIVPQQLRPNAYSLEVRMCPRNAKTLKKGILPERLNV